MRSGEDHCDRGLADEEKENGKEKEKEKEKEPGS